MNSLIARMIQGGRLDRRFARPSAELDYSNFQLSGNEKVTIRFLGTATFVIEGGGRTLVFDPYVSRPNLQDHLKPLIPNKKRILATFPKADDVFVGHAHSDHILDAPDLCIKRKARLVGSKSVCITGRAAGVPEELLHEVTGGGEVIKSGDSGVQITALKSYHGFTTKNRFLMRQINRDLARFKTPDNRDPVPVFDVDSDDAGVIFPQDTREDLIWPAYTWELGCGQVYDWLVEIEGVKIMHIDSARVNMEELKGRKADIVCLCGAGRKNVDNFTRDVIELLKPEVIIPCHWDNFFAAPDSKNHLRPLRGADIRGWMRELRDYSKEIHLLRYDQTFGV